MPDEQYIKLMESYDNGGIKEEDIVDTEMIKLRVTKGGTNVIANVSALHFL